MTLACFALGGLMSTVTALTTTSLPFATSGSAPLPLVSNIFELDSNALQNNGGGGLPDDWARLYAGQGSADTFTGILCDRSGQGCNPEIMDTIFVGGRKDIQDISEWGWKTASGLPDKDDITNAYAAAYEDPVSGRLILYYGADRYSNVGDAFLGYWFLKSKIEVVNGNFVAQNPDGSFSAAHHEVGDILVLVNFPQAAGAVPEFAVVEWNPAMGDAATNLHFLGGGPGQSILCNATDVPPSSVCATTNSTGTVPPSGATPSPWPYKPKSGSQGIFPYESFFEGGIDLAQFGVFDTCFSTFICETRSSKQFTATLKDFTIGSFQTCHVACGSTSCAPATPSHNADFSDLIFDFSACVENDGNGTLPAGSTLTVNLVGTDGDAVYADAAHTLPVEVQTVLAAPLVPGGSACVQGQFHTVNNPVHYAFSASIDGAGGVHSETVPGAACGSECVVNIPDMSVTKECESVVLEVVGSSLCIRVNFSGSVTNTGNRALQVSLSDNPAATIVLDPPDDPAGFLLAVGATVNYSGYYYPTAADGGETDPCQASFTDVITATGNCGGAECPIQRQASATCSCPNPK